MRDHRYRRRGDLGPREAEAGPDAATPDGYLSGDGPVNAVDGHPVARVVAVRPSGKSATVMGSLRKAVGSGGGSLAVALPGRHIMSLNSRLPYPKMNLDMDSKRTRPFMLSWTVDKKLGKGSAAPAAVPSFPMAAC